MKTPYSVIERFFEVAPVVGRRPGKNGSYYAKWNCFSSNWQTYAVLPNQEGWVCTINRFSEKDRYDVQPVQCTEESYKRLFFVIDIDNPNATHDNLQSSVMNLAIALHERDSLKASINGMENWWLSAQISFAREGIKFFSLTSPLINRLPTPNMGDLIFSGDEPIEDLSINVIPFPSYGNLELKGSLFFTPDFSGKQEHANNKSILTDRLPALSPYRWISVIPILTSDSTKVIDKRISLAIRACVDKRPHKEAIGIKESEYSITDCAMLADLLEVCKVVPSGHSLMGCADMIKDAMNNGHLDIYYKLFDPITPTVSPFETYSSYGAF
jgi:hypothetical protein